MASDITKSQHPAFVITDPRWTYSDAFNATDSSITQASPLPGIPVAESDTSMRLQATGTQAAAKELRVRTLQPGMPGPDGARNGWRYSGDSLWRGWDIPDVLTGWETIDFTTTAAKWLYPHAVTLADGAVLVAVQKSGNAIVVLKRSATADTWSEIAVATHGAYTYGAFPTLCVLPSGRILVYFWWEDGTSANVRYWYSDDDGATWSFGSRGVLPQNISTGSSTPRRLRAAAYGGQVLLVAGVTTAALAFDHVLKQYASTDGGASFDLVETWDGFSVDTAAAYHDLVVVDGKFTLGYLYYNGANVVPGIRQIANAYSPFSSAQVIAGRDTSATVWDWATNTATVIDYPLTPPTSAAPAGGEYALALDEDGVLYAFGRSHTGGGALRECMVVRSVDAGATWESVGTGSSPSGVATWWNHGDDSCYPNSFAATFQAGRAILPHCATADGTTTDPSLRVAYLGGYSTVTMPGSQVFATATKRTAWERTWTGILMPDGGSTPLYAYGTAGAPAASLTTNGVNLTGAIAESAVYSVTPTSTFAQGVLGLAEGFVTSGTATVGIRIGVAGPVDYRYRVEITATSVRVYDQNAAAYVTLYNASTTLLTAIGATGIQVLVAIGEPTSGGGNIGQGQVWIRGTGGVCDSDRAFSLLCSTTTLQAGATFTTNNFSFGNTTTAAAFDVTFRMACYTAGAYTGTSSERLYAGQSNPADLFGRAYSAGTPVTVDGGTKIRAVDGPTARGDVFDIDTHYLYGIKNLWPEVAPSPFRGWRSTGLTQEDIVWWADATHGESAGMRTSRVLVILEANWRTATLSGYDSGGGAYVTLASIDMAAGMTSLRWTRAGNILRPDTGANAASFHFPEHGLARCHIRLDGTPDYRKIRTNSAGFWTNSTVSRPSLLIEGAAVGDPTSGTAAVISSRAAVIVLADTDTYTKYRLRIDAQTTSEGYLAIGALQWGHLVPFGSRPAWNRTITTKANVRVTEMESGTAQAVTLGISRRTVDLGWVDGTDLSQLYATTPSPDYLLPYTGATVPVASASETPGTLAGIASQIGSGGGLLTYIGAWLPAASAVPVVINDPDRFIYGRLVGDIQLSTVLGHEYANPGEVVTVAGVSVREEV